MQVFHGTIIACDSASNVYRYLVEDRGRILHVGDELPEKYKSKAHLVDLGEKALIPCFGDGHLHFSSWALFAVAYFDVRTARNFNEIGEIINNFAVGDKKSKILISFGISSHSLEEKRLITRKELDAMYSDRPLVIICYDGHSLVGNGKFIDLCPDNIRELRGFNADTGQLFHEAYFKGVDYATSTVSPLFMVESIIKSFDVLAEKGIGLIHPVEGIGFPKDLDVTLVSMIARARAKKNGFQTRIFFQTMDVEKVQRRKLPRIGGCFATALDGCFGARDAALVDPYTDDKKNRGILFYSDKEVIEFAKAANRKGLQIELHAIGDAAVNQALLAIEKALEDVPRTDHRHTIIHASLLSPENLKKCAELGIGITLQPACLISPLEPASYIKKIVGSRIRINSPLRNIINAGIHLSGGSDAPVTPPDPIEGLYGACNHPFDKKQSLTIQEALKMFTYEVAWGSFDEKERGSLEKGKVADLAILNQNPLEMNPKNLRSLKVERLLLAGKVYRPGMGIPGMLFHALSAGRENIRY